MYLSLAVMVRRSKISKSKLKRERLHKYFAVFGRLLVHCNPLGDLSANISFRCFLRSNGLSVQNIKACKKTKVIRRRCFIFTPCRPQRGRHQSLCKLTERSRLIFVLTVLENDLSVKAKPAVRIKIIAKTSGKWENCSNFGTKSLF